MSCIAIMGESGQGKTTSLRHLDPATTFIIAADQKGLSWRGWKRQYSEEKKNYKKTSKPSVVKDTLVAIDKRAPYIKTAVIDTVNAIMIDDEMARMKQKGFDKWVDLAQSVYDLVRYSNEVRDDLTVVLIFHCARYTDENTNETIIRILTNGRKLEKIQLETKVPILLYAKCRSKKDGENEYFFETQANNSTAKSPLGMFDSLEIPNDLQLVLDRVREYEMGDNDENGDETVDVEKIENEQSGGRKEPLTEMIAECEVLAKELNGKIEEAYRKANIATVKDATAWRDRMQEAKALYEQNLQAQSDVEAFKQAYRDQPLKGLVEWLQSQLHSVIDPLKLAEELSEKAQGDELLVRIVNAGNQKDVATLLEIQKELAAA